MQQRFASLQAEILYPSPAQKRHAEAKLFAVNPAGFLSGSLLTSKAAKVARSIAGIGDRHVAYGRQHTEGPVPHRYALSNRDACL